MNLAHTDVAVKPKRRKAVAHWLLACMALVVAMVILGGYTRLSGSGLSITDWHPIHGTIPPIGEAEWMEEFEGYRQIPQYANVNPGMTLEEFKIIFWPEYLHRMLGRLIGIVFLLPLLFFWLKKDITSRFALTLAGIFALGGLQGLMGWYMVQSGLAELSYVSHFRLTAHLALAFLIFGLLLWQWLKLLSTKPLPFSRGHRRLWLAFSLLCVQILYGGLVAGLHAGLVYNSWPLMGGALVPEDFFAFEPAIYNLVGNIASVQWIHRWLAMLVLILYGIWRFTIQREYAKSMYPVWLVRWLLIAVVAQVVLGIATLVLQVPLALGMLHQLGALALFGLTLAMLYRYRNH